MRLEVDVFKSIGVKIAEKVLLMNDYLKAENMVMHKKPGRAKTSDETKNILINLALKTLHIR